MPVLILNHTARLNLHALIGAQRASVDDMRLYWKLQDRINLTDSEREAVGYRTLMVDGLQQVGWDASKVLPPQEYEFTPEEFQKLTKVVRSWEPGYLASGDRQWLEPLLDQLEQNGQSESLEPQLARSPRSTGRAV